MESVSPAPTYRADWYPDPLHRFELRYFNGRNWTADVSTNGQRFVDPWGIHPSPVYGAHHGPRERKSGKAVTSLILGCTAVALAWLPFVFVVAAVLALLSFGFAVAARRDVRRGRRGAGFATTGMILSPVALVLCFVGYWFTLMTIDLLESGPYAATVTQCERQSEFVVVGGTLTNLSSNERTYSVTITVVDPTTGRPRGSDVDQVRSVAPNATSRFEGRVRADVDDPICRVEVTRGLNFLQP